MLKMLTERELDGVFANIEEILLCNTVRAILSHRVVLSLLILQSKTFLSSLEDRQKESRLYIDTVADLIESHAPNFEIYAVSLISLFHFLDCTSNRRPSRITALAKAQPLSNSKH